MDRYFFNESNIWKNEKMQDSVEKLLTKEKKEEKRLFFLFLFGFLSHRSGIVCPLVSSKK